MAGSRDSVRKDLLFIAGLVVLAAALLLYLATRSPGNVDSATPGAVPPMNSVPAAAARDGADGTGSVALERRQADDPFALGDPHAPVAMVVFSDFRCPFCAKFSRDTEPELVERFVDNGTLRIEWRDYPIFGEQSMLAARAGRAAAEQGKFWDFNRAVFAASPERAKADLTEEALIGFAEQAGVADMDRFVTAMRGDRFDAAINADLAQGNSIGVPSTPAFLINNQPLLGAQPTEEFVRAINAAKENL
ncbi:disulfide bond formation protein [Mycolicibacterium sp. GF69]|uniref:DsbA family protein n=1 Tax=Mycolicibacterium sp. GF69 TaxID=2267251 RepID=UPI000DCCC05E|nr:thioredoxin domain-containing protein [Mycolicibacterium sp. GF69]RAV18382.1 disulfide bond formation protein [Mycolicibacterium sp. GF69]